MGDSGARGAGGILYWGFLGRPWGDLGGSWGDLRGVLGPPGAILGGLGVVFGGVLGRLDAVLGGSWNDLKKHRVSIMRMYVSWCVSNVCVCPCWGGLGGILGRLGSISARFGGSSGGHFYCFSIGFPMFFCKSRFSHETHVNREYVCLLVCVKRACVSVLGRSWSIFGRPRGHLDPLLRKRIRGSAAEAWAL